jgi:phosphoglycerate kinase
LDDHGRPGRLRTLEDVDLRGRRVLLRADLNVPLTADGQVADASRIDATLPTLRRLLDAGCAVVVASHLGRPKGRVVPALSLAPVARVLSERLGRPVPLAPGVTGPEVAARVRALGPGEVLLLENLRFDPREERDDPAFAAELAQGLDLLVDDAFGAVHRAHASVHALAGVLESVAGLLVAREVEMLSRLMGPVERPYAVVLGGAKVADKLGMVAALGERADRLIVGGGMANTFLLARGGRMGRSLAEPERAADARALMERLGERLFLPVDLVVGSSPDDPDPRVVEADAVPDDAMALDIGPATRARFAAALADARTVFWNGPMGVFERPAYRAGTQAVAAAVAAVSGLSVVGGGDSVAALHAAGVASHIGHVSTGGGASLEFVEGRDLPGLRVLGYRPPGAR